MYLKGGDRQPEGMMVYNDGKLQKQPVLNCLNLEYYNQDIIGNDRILKAYADSPKGIGIF